MKKTKLKDLKLKSVDFCNVGANQEAFILLKKSMEEGSHDMLEVWKQFTEKATESMTESFKTILEDGTLDSMQKGEMVQKSIGEFLDTVREFSNTTVQKNEPDEPLADSTELHPEVKKALEETEFMKSELEEMKKSLEIGKMELIAKKYEVLGKKVDELAPKLYEMKKSGGTIYHEYISLLDEQIEMVEKSGVFKEFGSNRGGSNDVEKQLSQKIEDLRKADTSLSYEQAFVRVCDDYPEIRKAFEQ